MMLDARQKAMLREMGVRVWWPSAKPAETAAHDEEPAEAATAAASHRPAPASAGPSGAGRAAKGADIGADAQAHAARPSQADPSAQAMPRPTRSAAGASPSSPTDQAAAAEPAQGGAMAWELGPLQALHEAGAAEGPCWLLLVEQRQDNSGDGQRLLQAMLKAARLHQGCQVWLAPLRRVPGSGAVQGLEAALSQSQPDLVFIMSRLGAQALLETDEPLGRLRGQVHELWGLPALVSYDPVTLLHSPGEKGKAWDDLCLATGLAREQYAERRASEE